jgi:GNAT superfamily N-acetyltransferase
MFSTEPLPHVSLPAALEVRAARAADLDALLAMVRRCSPETIYRRFHGAAGPAVTTELRRVANGTTEHRSWVVTEGSRIHGTATLAWGRDGTVEAAFLVEDGWFRHGVGRRLFAAVAREARRECVPVVTAWVQSDNERARRFFRSVAPGARTSFGGGGELEIHVPVPLPDQCPDPIRHPSTVYEKSA